MKGPLAPSWRHWGARMSPRHHRYCSPLHGQCAKILPDPEARVHRVPRPPWTRLKRVGSPLWRSMVLCGVLCAHGGERGWRHSVHCLPRFEHFGMNSSPSMRVCVCVRAHGTWRWAWMCMCPGARAMAFSTVWHTWSGGGESKGVVGMPCTCHPPLFVCLSSHAARAVLPLYVGWSWW